jgi:hypothetical protein
MDGHKGLTSESQLRGIAPYLRLLSPSDIRGLWEACNKAGWYPIRRELLDGLLEPPYLRGMWDTERAISELDEMANEKGTFRVRFWLDDYLNADTKWREIMETVTKWSENRQTIAASKIVAAAVEHNGSRRDLDHLKVLKGSDEMESKHLITDTVFAVKRRRLD